MSVSTIRNNAPAIAALFEAGGKEATTETCDAVKEGCEEEVRFRTGSLSVSFYSVVDGGEDGYEAAVTEAKDRNKHVVILEKVEPPPGGGAVSAAAGHNQVNEYGGPHISPLPVMHSVSDRERPKHTERVIQKLKKVTG